MSLLLRACFYLGLAGIVFFAAMHAAEQALGSAGFSIFAAIAELFCDREGKANDAEWDEITKL